MVKRYVADPRLSLPVVNLYMAVGWVVNTNRARLYDMTEDEFFRQAQEASRCSLDEDEVKGIFLEILGEAERRKREAGGGR